MNQIEIPAHILEEMTSHAKTENPNECCGLLSGCNGIVVARHALKNDSPTPERAYFASPRDLFRAMREIRSAGNSLLAIYHSHPRGPAYPSVTDISMAFYPDVINLVISLAAEPEIRAFGIRDGLVETADLVVAPTFPETF